MNQGQDQEQQEPDLDKQYDDKAKEAKYDEIYEDGDNFNARIENLENRIQKNVKVTISLFSQYRMEIKREKWAIMQQ